jgi:hypothetical protein
MSIDPHFREHDPILDANHCERCNAALRHTLILLADLDLGPKDATTLAKKIREIALGLEPPPIQTIVAPEFGEIDPGGCRFCIFGGADGEHADPCPLHVCSECADADIDIPLPPR